jgi:hypothetical protein
MRARAAGALARRPADGPLGRRPQPQHPRVAEVRPRFRVTGRSRPRSLQSPSQDGSPPTGSTSPNPTSAANHVNQLVGITHHTRQATPRHGLAPPSPDNQASRSTATGLSRRTRCKRADRPLADSCVPEGMREWRARPASRRPPPFDNAGSPRTCLMSGRVTALRSRLTRCLRGGRSWVCSGPPLWTVRGPPVRRSFGLQRPVES